MSHFYVLIVNIWGTAKTKEGRRGSVHLNISIFIPVLFRCQKTTATLLNMRPCIELSPYVDPNCDT